MGFPSPGRQRILSVHYSIPDYVRVSKECKHLLSTIFVADPEKRITIPEIKKHLWFQKNLTAEFNLGSEAEGKVGANGGELGGDGGGRGWQQTMEEVAAIIQEARKGGDGLKLGGNLIGCGGSMELDDLDADMDDIDDVETSGDFVCAL